MQYLMLLYSDENVWPKLSKAEQEEWMAAYQAFHEAITKFGALKRANRLQPTSSAKTVRITGGKRQVFDGPFIESKEQVGGYYLIDAPNLDAALTWAAQCPCARHGSVEVRPLWEAGG